MNSVRDELYRQINNSVVPEVFEVLSGFHYLFIVLTIILIEIHHVFGQQLEPLDRPAVELAYQKHDLDDLDDPLLI